MKLWIPIIMLCILSTFATAVLYKTDSDLLGYWDLEDSGSSMADSKNNGLNQCNLVYDGGSQQQAALTPYSGSFSLGFTPDEAKNNTCINPYLMGMHNFTIFFWYYNANLGAEKYVLSWNTDGTSGFQIKQEAGGNIKWIVVGSIAHTIQNTPKQYSLYTLRFNGTHYALFINTTQSGVEADTTSIDISPAPLGLSLGTHVYGNDALGFAGQLDEIAIFNRSLTLTEINDYYTSGLAAGTSPSSTSPPVIEDPTPADGITTNYNITLNVSHDTTNNDVRYWLYFGTSTSLDEGDIYIYNDTRFAAEYRNFTTNVSDGTYYYWWKVQNKTSGAFSSNTTMRTWILDTTSPTITLNAENEFNLTDTVNFNQYDDYMFINITAQDETSLFGFLINITKGGNTYYNFTNITLGENTTYNFTDNVSLTGWAAGVYDINVSASDAHTALQIQDYDVRQLLGKITFDTEEKNEISISGNGAIGTTYNRKKDRYEFGFNYMSKATTRTFTLKSKNKIYYLPNSPYKGHFVILSDKLNGNWIDFEGLSDKYTVTKISDFEYEITFTNLPFDNKLIARSIGGVNVFTYNLKYYRGNYTSVSPTKGVFGDSITFSLNISRNTTYVFPNATFIFDGTEYASNVSFGEDHIFFTNIVTMPNPTGDSQKYNYSWFVNITQVAGSNYYFNVSSTINITNTLIDNCTFHNNTVLNISGLDEETDLKVNISLNIFFDPDNGDNVSYELTGRDTYSFCSSSATNYTLDSIMEYGDGVVYADRKYYLNDYNVNIGTTSIVYLYHLNQSKASEVTYTIFDRVKGDKVEGAYLKILRYYPGQNAFKTVEIERTDGAGQALGKVVLADVFYKYIIEKPAGTVKLNSEVARVLSLTRSFGISFVTDTLDTWNKMHDVSTSVTCTKDTNTCSLTWSDTNNIVRDATLKVYRSNGIADTLLSSQTTASAAGTISYTITESTTGNSYTANGYIESNTGTSTYLAGIAGLIYSDNPFFTDSTSRLASLFPLLLLVVVIVFALIDFGAIGVVIGSLLGMVLGTIIGILPLSPFYFISFIVMVVILIVKLQK